MMPTSTDVRVSVSSKLPKDLEAIAVFAAEGAKLSGDAPMVLPGDVLGIATRLLEEEIVRGTAREVDLLEMPGKRMLRVYAAGLGAAEKLTAESVRRSAGALMRAVRRHRLRRVGIVPPVVRGARAAEAVGTDAVVTGLLLSAFDFRECRGAAYAEEEKKNAGKGASRKGPVEITLLASSRSSHVIAASARRAQVITDAQNYARTICSRPGNVVNPPVLAGLAQSLAKELGIGCRVLDDRQIKRLGMGGLAAVGGGSRATPPRLIALEYRGPKTSGRGKSVAPLMIVGKAITFDTGGISIKPAEKMQKMIYDKCGGVEVLGLMAAVAKLRLPVHLVGILSSAENHVSDAAYRPGDILHMYNGVTVEVTNTDAEGRLVLGDALAWGIETYKPSAVIDLATLTGGVIVALGRDICGVMANNDGLFDELNRAAMDSGEKMWRLPLGPEQREQIKSDLADIVNSAGRDAHPLQGGAFLSYFVPENGSVPWAHLDIAGVADTEKELPYYGKGATGWGIRTLVKWIEMRTAEGAGNTFTCAGAAPPAARKKRRGK
jgi:leucyl aminopeptidase